MHILAWVLVAVSYLCGVLLNLVGFFPSFGIETGSLCLLVLGRYIKQRSHWVQAQVSQLRISWTRSFMISFGLFLLTFLGQLVNWDTFPVICVWHLAQMKLTFSVTPILTVLNSSNVDQSTFKSFGSVPHYWPLLSQAWEECLYSQRSLRISGLKRLYMHGKAGRMWATVYRWKKSMEAL